MQETCFQEDWYAAFVKTGDESNVKERLKYRFKDSLGFYVPKREMKERRDGKWCRILRTVFPGYVLINGHIDVEEYYRLKYVPNMYKLLTQGTQITPIDSHEIDTIVSLMRHGEIIGTSSIMRTGEKVKVLDGPLVGMEGKIQSINERKNRVRIIVPFLGSERVVDLAVELLKSVDV